ncbi:MAG: hypothetical protein HYT20_00335 [Candidatus Nealsonbacteria bacterium]|nr:hypothetical protein [Candidatus Nealsonbacteria bacterium]
MSRKAHGPKHHIVPTSIGGPRYNEENVYHWRGREHYFYHRAFVNRPPSVVIKIIEGLTDANGNWNQILMSPDDYENLQKAFLGKEPANAINFIKKEFLPIEEKWLRGELPEVELPEYQYPFKKVRRKKNKRGLK